MLHKRLIQEYGFTMLAVPWEPTTTTASLKAQGRIPLDCPRVFVTYVIFLRILCWCYWCDIIRAWKMVRSALVTTDQRSAPNNKLLIIDFLTSFLRYFFSYSITHMHSQDVFVNPKVLIIVQGLGKVAPGQWARKLFTNGHKDQFDYASQIPYIERALHLGWAIILCDPNRPELSPASSASAQGSMSMWLHGGDTRGRSRSDHVRRVWEDLIR